MIHSEKELKYEQNSPCSKQRYLPGDARKAINAKTASVLLWIPIEIRLSIYHFLLRDEELCLAIEARSSDDPSHALSLGASKPRAHYDRPNIGSFLQTCRQIRAEALHLFHAIVELRVINLRSNTRERCMANFPNIRLVNPLIPWEDLERAQLLRVRRLTIDKGEVYWGDLGISLSPPLDGLTLAHHGADNIVNSYMALLWVNKMTMALQQMRMFSRVQEIEETNDLSVTMNFSTLPADGLLLQLQQRLRYAPGPTYFSLTLTNDDRFTLRYTHEDQDYVVKQKRLVAL